MKTLPPQLHGDILLKCLDLTTVIYHLKDLDLALWHDGISPRLYHRLTSEFLKHLN